MRQRANRYAVMATTALVCGGCAIAPATIATSLMTSAGTRIAMDALFGESQMTRDARAAFERAPPCASMSHGVQNGRIVTVVRDIAWFDDYDFGDGRRLVPARGNGLVMVDYQIINRSDDDVTVTPRRLAVTDAKGKVTREKAGVGGLQSSEATPEDSAILPIDQGWSMVSVFEVPPGEYALMVPNGRVPGDPEPTWVDGCRFPGPIGMSQG